MSIVAAINELVAILKEFTFMNRMTRLIALTFLLSITILFCHSQIKITYGSLGKYTTNSTHFAVPINEFKKQKELVVPKGFILDSAKVYFTFPSQQSYWTMNYEPDFDSSKFTRCLNQLYPGSVVSFYDIVLSDSAKNLYRADPIFFTFYSFASDKSNENPDSLRRELKYLSTLNFTEGAVFFSGTNFATLTTYQLDKKSKQEFKNLIKRCAAGTKIVFYNAKYVSNRGKEVRTFYEEIILR